tara:strand:+ start:32 stop:2221 length:2190 start_codon:yes stop_codon:yes gene_type:complete
MKKKEGSYDKEEESDEQRSARIRNRRQKKLTRVNPKSGVFRVPIEKKVSGSGRIDPAPLKAVIGWATSKADKLPEDNSGGFSTKNLYKFLDRSNLTLLLNVSKYSIDFGDQGQITLKLELTGYADNVLSGASSSNIFTNPWRIKYEKVHPRIKKKNPLAKGLPNGVTDTVTPPVLAVTDIFGTTIDKLKVSSLPTIVQPDKGGKIDFSQGYLTGIIQRKKVALKGASAQVMAGAKVTIEPAILVALIEVAQEDVELAKYDPKDTDKKVSERRSIVSEFQRIHKKVVEAVKGDVYRNFLERLEASGAILGFNATAKELGITITKTTEENPNAGTLDPTNDEITTVSSTIDRTQSEVAGRRLTQAPVFFAAGIGSATFAAAGAATKEKRGKDSGGTERGTGVPYTIPDAASTDGTFVIPITFMRLGDIIDTAFHSSGFFTHNRKRKDGLFRVVLDTMYVHIPSRKVTEKVELSLSDLPIQLAAFEVFFFENYVKKGVTNITFKTFVTDLMKFVGDELTNGNLIGENNQFEPMTVSFTAPNVNGKPLLPKKTYTESDVEFRPNTSPPSGFAAKREAEATLNMESLNSYFIIGLIQTPERDGDPKIDHQRGIYHLILGSGRGPVKSIKFSEQDVSEHIRTMNIRDGSADFPTVPQNATVNLYGSPHFWQGQMVYIDADYAMPDASRVMGIGGYYMVTKVTHDLNLGEFTTTLECRWQNRKRSKKKGKTRESNN